MKKILFLIGLATSVFACQQSTPPVINAFDATPTSVTSGATVKFSWNVSGANSLEIDQGVGVVTGSTSKDIVVTSSKTFTLTAKNTNGSVTKSVNVTTTGVPASGGKLKIQNWLLGQQGKIGGTKYANQPTFPVINIASDGSFEYALNTPTADQLSTVTTICTSFSMTSSNAAARFTLLGFNYLLTTATVGDASQSTGSIIIATSQFAPPPLTVPLKIVQLVYASEATKVSGDCGGLKYEANLEIGWNYLSVTATSLVPSLTITGSITASTTLPTDMNWYYLPAGSF